MAKQGSVLFELSIGQAGKIVVTEPAKKVYLLTFSSPPDNRLTTTFCKAIHLAFDIIQTNYPAGVVVTTSAVSKFYSNGLDLEHATSTPGFFSKTLYGLWHRILTYPMPTVALVNGHAFAGGFMLAMMHDYRIMNPHRGFLCLNELALGVGLRPPMCGVFREKVKATTFRRIILEVVRFKALNALEEGLVDSLGDLEETLKFIGELDLVGKAQPGMSGQAVYGVLKREMYRETVEYLERGDEEDARDLAIAEKQKREDLARDERVAAWKKAKL
ncbi:hypothetical protein WHR41_02557 [Cladosporium halotolerans]|uniref:Uncharacterized protein n=1 Tax=Cladosporium halotolerans TaxID=1052096 RepID=A0AB34KX04_9PEZI